MEMKVRYVSHRHMKTDLGKKEETTTRLYNDSDYRFAQGLFSAAMLAVRASQSSLAVSREAGVRPNATSQIQTVEMFVLARARPEYLASVLRGAHCMKRKLHALEEKISACKQKRHSILARMETNQDQHSNDK